MNPYLDIGRINASAEPGVYMDDAMQAAITLATQLNTTVRLEFNGTRINIDKRTSLLEAKRRWEAERERQRQREAQE
jgi:hypothetical protein